MNAILIPTVAVAAGGAALGLILGLVAQFMHVPVDPLEEEIREALPGANCGACGYAGCDAYAEVLANKSESNATLCTPGGAKVVGEICALLGIEAGEVIPMTAVLHCNGTPQHTKPSSEYSGEPTCAAATTYFNGPGSCSYGCIGFGDCVATCQFDAIYMNNGIPVIDKSRCTGCTTCAAACPKDLISMEPTASLVHVTCSSQDRGPVVRKACDVGCIACMRCVRVCKYDAITVENFIATIDTEKCTNCFDCVEECPQNCIEIIPVPEKMYV